MRGVFRVGYHCCALLREARYALSMREVIAHVGRCLASIAGTQGALQDSHHGARHQPVAVPENLGVLLGAGHPLGLSCVSGACKTLLGKLQTAATRAKRLWKRRHDRKDFTFLLSHNVFLA